MQLIYDGGHGYDGVNEKGVFEVDVKGYNKRFKRLSNARKYYDRIELQKYLWDLTSILPVILECHVVDTFKEPTIPFWEIDIL